MLTGQIGESTEVVLNDFSTGINLAQYRKQVEAYIRANENHVAVAKLKHNKPLTPQTFSGAKTNPRTVFTIRGFGIEA
ncbi:hypothetical protein [Metapseudomonas resinovorans]|uniref:hypothetical protein n=1 Tax=Metapseudomonas resinovorans TaxID=53412 RepID=UPI0003FD0B51|nr:hypothetical protein [Pseudomonas resinovorans]